MYKKIPLTKMQKQAITFAMDNPRSAWFIPPGGGKTRSWLETINETPGQVLVVAPKVVCASVWPDEIRKWGYQFDWRILHGSWKRLDKQPDAKVTLINYEGLPWLAERLIDKPNPFDYIIYDELSKMKNPTTNRFVRWKNMMDRFDFVSGGTGTPVGNHLIDLYGEMYCIDQGESLGPSYERFRNQYFHVCDYSYKITPYYGVEKEILDLIKHRAIAWDINDLSMPALSHIPCYLKLPENVVEHYLELKEHGIIDDFDVHAANAAVKSGKRRQVASGAVYNDRKELVYLHTAKAEYLKNIVDDVGGRPVMIFFEYRHDYQIICETLGEEVPVIAGGTSASHAAKLVRKWNAGKLKYIALQPRSASYGLNMQDSGNIIVWYTTPWSNELIQQGIGRIWRRGQKNKVIVYYLIIQGTEDERVYQRAAVEKMETHELVMSTLTRK